MHVAPAEAANSRYLSSLGSRQTWITAVIGINSAIAFKSSMIISRLIKDNYLSNLGMINKSLNSLNISSDKTILPEAFAL